MASNLDICNLALGHIGHGVKILALNPPDGTKESEYCASFYPIARDVCLSSGIWSFAKRRESLASIGTPPDGWDYQYAQPNGYIKAISLVQSGDETPTTYIQENDATHGNIILTNTDSAEFRFIYRVEDTSKYSSDFVVAMSWLLASFLAGPLAQKTRMAEAAYKYYVALVGMANVNDGTSQKLGGPDQTAASYKPSAIRARS